jgi:tight adherence protein B
MDLAALLGGSGDGTEFLMIGGLVVGVLLLFAGLFSGGEARRQMARRIARVKLHDQPEEAIANQIQIARRRAGSSDIPALDQIIKRLMPRQDMLLLRLSRAGLEISLGVYVLASLLTGGLGFVAMQYLFSMPLLAAILFALFSALAFPHVYVGSRIKRRQMRFIEHFPDAIDLMVRGLKAGLPIAESIRTAGEEIPDPVGLELRRITDAVRIGRKINEVLLDTARRMNLQEFNFFTIALSIQAETGGNLAETLNNLAEVLRGRRQLKRKIKALSSEAKASAYIIGSLPFIMTGLIYLVNSSYIMGLFNDTRGQILIGFGLAMIAAGAGVMYRMVKFEI